MTSAVTVAAWAWIPIVVWAAFAQTLRNAAQRSLTGAIGTLPATLVRFLYGLPCAIVWLLIVWRAQGAPALPGLAPGYAAWLAGGALAQLGATAALLMAMKERNFIVAVTWSKTEVLQVALFGTLFLGELPGWVSLAAMAVAGAGVVLLSRPSGGAVAADGSSSRAVLWGLASGALFALSSVGFRGAALQITGSTSPWIAGAWGVVWAQLLQSLLLGGWLAWRDRAGLVAIARSWRLSLTAGSMGALASIGWFTAMALRPAADVRTLGMVEVLFSYLVSRRVFREALAPRERWGLLLVVVGVMAVCVQLS